MLSSAAAQASHAILQLVALQCSLVHHPVPLPSFACHPSAVCTTTQHCEPSYHWLHCHAVLHASATCAATQPCTTSSTPTVCVLSCHPTTGCATVYPCAPAYHWFCHSVAFCATYHQLHRSMPPLSLACHLLPCRSSLSTIIPLVSLQCSLVCHPTVPQPCSPSFVPNCSLVHYPTTGRAAVQPCLPSFCAAVQACSPSYKWSYCRAALCSIKTLPLCIVPQHSQMCHVTTGCDRVQPCMPSYSLLQHVTVVLVLPSYHRCVTVQWAIISPVFCCIPCVPFLAFKIYGRICISLNLHLIL